MAKTDLNVFETNPLRGSTATLQGGLFNTSFVLSNTSSIAMGEFTGGALDWDWTSGNGSVVLATYTSPDNVSFYPLYTQKDDGSFVTAPTITTPTSGSASFAVEGIKSAYVKFVPTVSGTVNGLFKFTPSK